MTFLALDDEGNLPEIEIVAAFGYQPNDASPVWTDLTPRFRHLEATRMRNDEFGKFQPGELVATLDNSDDALNSKNGSSPYAGQIKPNVRVAVNARWNSVVYPLGVFFADFWQPRYPGEGIDSTVELQATGFFKRLQKGKLSLAGTARIIIGGTPLLKSSIDETATTFTISYWPGEWPASGDFPIQIEDEFMLVTGGHGTTTLTVTRGYADSTAAAHDGTTETNVFCLRCVDVSDTSLTLDAWPDLWPDQGDVEILIDSERMLVTAGAGTTTPTVTRGYNGTTAAPHPTETSISRPNFGAGLTGKRLTDVWAFLQFDTADANFDAGLAEIPDAADLTSTSALDHMQSVAEDTEDGVLFEAADGRVTFHDRHHRLLNSLTAAATFSDSSGAGYDGLEPDFSDTYLYNEAQVTWGDSEVEVVRDQPSIDEHGLSTHQRTTLLTTVTDAHGLGDWIVYRHKTPKQRVPKLTAKGVSDPATMWPALLGLEVSDRVTVERTPPGGAQWTEDYYFEGVKHTVDPKQWSSQVALTPIADFFWILEDATYGQLESTTRLGY